MFDLVDEMCWEDSDQVEFVSLESANLEASDCDTIGRLIWDHYYSVEQ